MTSLEIFNAVERNDLENVKMIIEKGDVSPTIKKDVRTLAHVAIMKGNLDILKYLLEKDTSLLNIGLPRGLPLVGHCTLLDLAVEGGHLDIVKYLVENHNADIYEVFHEKWTAINWAVIKGHLNITKYFIDERNVDVNKLPIPESYYEYYCSIFRPLLFDAVEYDRKEIITYLIEEKKANMAVVDFWNENILFKAVRKGDLDLMRYILDEKKAEIDLNWKNRYNDYTLLHVIATEPIIMNYEKILQYLIREKHANPSITVGKKRRTPLHLAVIKENHLIIVPFIDCGIDMEQKDIDGNTALHLAVSRERSYRIINMCQDLCKHGADVDQKNKKGKTPLQCLLNQFSEDDVEISKILVEHGASVKSTDEKGNQLVHIAVMRDQMSLLEYLVRDKRVDANTPRKGDGWTPLHCAVFHDHFEICEYLSDHGADINRKNKRNETPLDIALVKLFKSGANSKNQETFNICKLLIENGANINSTDKTGNQLVHIAAMKNNLDFLDYLVCEKHVDINTPRETDNWTPLHVAAMSDHFYTCQYLIKHGAKIKAKSKLGKIPAEVTSDQRIFNYLENRAKIKRRPRNVENYLIAIPENLLFRDYRYQRIAKSRNSNSISFPKDDSLFGLQNFFSCIVLFLRYFFRDSTNLMRVHHKRGRVSTAEILQDNTDPIARHVIGHNFSIFTDA